MLLTILKYAGLLIAAISSVWGITTDTSKEVDGKKVLTRHGKISILLVCLGFLISVASSVTEDYQNAKERQTRIQEDIQRTNKIILAGQIVTSLKFLWKFGNMSSSSVNIVKRGDSIASKMIMDYQQGGVRGPSQNGPAYRYNSLYPFIKSITRGVYDNYPESLLVLISIDNNHNAILPLGFLRDSLSFLNGLNTSELSDSIKYPVGVETNSMNDMAFEGHGRTDVNFPTISNRGSSIQIEWNLDPITFHNSFNRQIDYVNPSALFADTIEIALLLDFDRVPFPSTNFAISPEYAIWEYEFEAEPDQTLDTAKIQKGVLSQSSLHFTPNNLNDQTAEYSFLRYTYHPAYEKETGEAPACNVITLYYVKKIPK